MTLHASSPRRERILLYGQEGCGKSYAWVTVAEWIHKTKGISKVWVVDTDLAWDAMRPEDGHLDGIVEVFPIHEWDDYRPAIQKVRENGDPDDWFVIDLVDKVWNESQSGYFAKVFGKDVDEFFLEAQIKDVSPGGDYGSNWVQIKRMYSSVVEFLPRFRGHVLCCATAEMVRKPDTGKPRTLFHDSVEVENRYGRYGWKPAGEKKIGHLFHTVILLNESPSGYKMSVVKDRGDRGKDKAMGKDVTPDFVVSYLFGNGWRP